MRNTSKLSASRLTSNQNQIILYFFVAFGLTYYPLLIAQNSLLSDQQHFSSKSATLCVRCLKA